MAAKEVICPNCHQPTSAEGAFCGNCGKPLTAAAQPPATTQDVMPPVAPIAPTPVGNQPTQTAPSSTALPPTPVANQVVPQPAAIPVDQLNIPSMDSIKEVKTASWLMIIMGGFNVLFSLYMVTMPQSYLNTIEKGSEAGAVDVQIAGGLQLIVGSLLVVFSILLMRSQSPKKAKSYLTTLIVTAIVLILLSLVGGRVNFIALIALTMAIRGLRVIKKLPQV